MYYSINTFLNFNVFAWIGSSLANYIQYVWFTQPENNITSEFSPHQDIFGFSFYCERYFYRSLCSVTICRQGIHGSGQSSSRMNGGSRLGALWWPLRVVTSVALLWFIRQMAYRRTTKSSAECWLQSSWWRVGEIMKMFKNIYLFQASWSVWLRPRSLARWWLIGRRHLPRKYIVEV